MSLTRTSGFRHYFLNTTNQQQLTTFVNQTANNIRRVFPAGLLTDVGVIVANPAYGEDPVCSFLIEQVWIEINPRPTCRSTLRISPTAHTTVRSCGHGILSR